MAYGRLHRRPKPRMGVRPDPKKARVEEAHRKWVRGHACLVAGADCYGRIEFAHVSKGLPADARKAGKGIKAGDEWGVPLCSGHHREQHQTGFDTFQRKYGIDLVKLAEQLAAASPALTLWRRQNDA